MIALPRRVAVVTGTSKAIFAAGLALAAAAPGAPAGAAAPDQWQPAPAAIDNRTSTELAQGWRFHLGDQPDAWKPQFDDAAWDDVVVPHNWNRMGGEAERRSDYQNVRGPAWYRIKFATPGNPAGRSTWLQFDAASIIAEVWLNGIRLGSHAGAFSRFQLNASAALRPAGEENVLSVRVDNSSPLTAGSPTAEVLPMGGDWPMYGGLYRPVSLVTTAATRIAMRDHGGPGIYARTERADTDDALISVLTRLENDLAAAAVLQIRTSIIDHAGAIAASQLAAAHVDASSTVEVRQQITLTNPHLWNGTADPYLYTLRVEVLDRGRTIDAVEQPLGVRTFRIDPDEGFFLNGNHLDLHGVSRHQDRPVKGWVISNADIAQDMDLVREIGANALRLAHYQHAPQAYDATDAAGLITWAEIPLVDRASPWHAENATPAFTASAESHLRELIRQNYNHPSIAVWSIANEVNLQAALGNGTSIAGPLLHHLQDVVHAEDPSRPATLADCCGPLPADPPPGVDAVTGITDVVGYNRYYGWYDGSVDQLGQDLDRLHALFPDQPISISEYGGGGALTQHTDDPLGGPIASFGRPHPEEFQSYILEESWKQIAARPFVWASWVWTMFDFSNDVRLEGDLTDTNDKGLVTFDRQTRKDGFYFFKANWSQDPFVHLTGRRYVDRAYAVTDVKAYSNLPSLELTLNGRKIGRTECRGGVCLWPDVSLEMGENQLLAHDPGSGHSDMITWRFDGDAGEWRIRSGTLSGKVAADGARWGSDVFVTGGEGNFRDQFADVRGAEAPPPRLVAGTVDQTPYESWREGTFSYRIPVPNGRYLVKLHFFEPDAGKRPGDRMFAVVAEGGAPRSIDVSAIAGATMTAATQELDVQVDDGTMDLSFLPVTGSPILSAVEVLPRK